MNHREKVMLAIMIAITLISSVFSMYLALNYTCTDIKTCKNEKIHVLNTSEFIDSDFEKTYQGLKNKIGNFDMKIYNPPLSSESIEQNDWNRIVRDINKVYKDYDAFVIVGTSDSIPYIASALAFMLENLGKPVVLTDKNLSQTLVTASQTSIPEVMVFEDGKLLRGCRTILDFPKFVSPRYDNLTKNNSIDKPSEPLQIKNVNPSNKISVIQVFPGITPDYVRSFLNVKGLQGLVIETWKNGKISSHDEILKAVTELAKKGVVIVALSPHTDIDMRLLESGALPGHDMTRECAYAKLAFLLGNVEDKKLIGKLMDISFRGEMTNDA